MTSSPPGGKGPHRAQAPDTNMPNHGVPDYVFAPWGAASLAHGVCHYVLAILLLLLPLGLLLVSLLFVGLPFLCCSVAAAVVVA